MWPVEVQAPETSLVPDPVLYVDGWPTLAPVLLCREQHIAEVTCKPSGIVTALLKDQHNIIDDQSLYVLISNRMMPGKVE